MRLAIPAALLLLLVLLPPPAAAGEEEGNSEANLLDGALERAGLRRTDFLVPADLVEVDPFRRAVVSRLLEHPLEMPGYARGLAGALRKQTSLLGMFQLILAQERIEISRPGRRFDVEGKVRYPTTSLEDLVVRVIGGAGERPDPDLEVLKLVRVAVPDLVREARAIYAEDAKGPEAGDAIWMTEVRRFLDRAAAFDRGALARVCEESLARCELLAAAISILPPELLARETSRVVDVGGLRVVIGGPGDDVHTGRADVVIDVGGNDIYRNLQPRGERSVIIDVSGRDTYVTNGILGPGAAELGFALVVDLAGDDVYRGGTHALACGIFGLGVIDDRAGNDVYECGELGLGAGVFGWGLLLDRAGNDVYVGRGFCQGFAGVDGFGALVDLAGNDVYVAGGKSGDPREKGVTQSLSQGFAYGMRPFASGGIALLLDAGGNDAYEGDYFAQGASYWFALGALVDLGGNDRYAARRYSGGAGIHLSLGVLIDESGNDAYAMGFGVGLGCGHDYAHGILLDMAGDDSYQGAWLCLGAGNANGTGIFCDVSGNDAYRATNKSLGWGTWDKKREAGSVGVFLDGTGDDAYTSPGIDGRSWTHGKHGAGIDGTGGDPFPAIDLATWLNARPARRSPEVGFFTKRDRFATSLRSGPPLSIVTLPEDDEVMEVLARFEPGLEEAKKEARRTLRKLAKREPFRLAAYLHSPNVLVVIETDRALRAAGDVAVPLLADCVLESFPSVRIATNALRILSTMETAEADAALRKVVPRVIGHHDGGLRRMALRAAVRTDPDDEVVRAAVVRLLSDPDYRTRTAAARLAGAWGIEETRERLTAMLDDTHRVARDAASEARASLDAGEER